MRSWKTTALIITTCCLCFCTQAFAQEPAAQESVAAASVEQQTSSPARHQTPPLAADFEIPDHDAWRLAFGYFGESALRPGLSIGASKHLVTWHSPATRLRRKDKRTNKIRYLQLGGRYFGYHHPVLAQAHGARAELSYRRVKLRYPSQISSFVEYGLMGGVGVTRLRGEVVTFDASGELVRGQRHYPALNGGVFATFGREIKPIERFTTSWYVRPQAYLEFPYAPRRQLHLAAELGVEITLAETAQAVSRLSQRATGGKGDE